MSEDFVGPAFQVVDAVVVVEVLQRHFSLALARDQLTFAPSAISAGAQSVDDAATQRLLAVATQQISPSFFRQKSIALRHS